MLPSEFINLFKGYPGGVLGVAFSLLVIFILLGGLVAWFGIKKQKVREQRLETAQNNEDLKYLGALFKLYNQQLSIYQDETRSRAAHSFRWAIISMVIGFVVLGFGGWRILIGGTPNDVLTGGTLAAIGGALSAFITKTFLDVHKVSLVQLNRYFKQPVLNSHILTAQRLSTDIKDETAKQKISEFIIHAVTQLLSAEQQQPEILELEAKIASSGRDAKTRSMVKGKNAQEG